MRSLVFVVGAAAVAGTALADGPRVTVVTNKGDAIEATMVGATETDLTVTLAGQSMTLKLSEIKYISMAGRLDGAGAGGAGRPAAGTREDAFAALDELRQVLEVGVLRAQYAEKLIELLPRVNAFIESGQDWPDARLALARAVDAYKDPLGEITQYRNPWASASYYFSVAGRYVDLARSLFADPAEKDHVESQEVRELAFPGTADGRIGAGDMAAPEGGYGLADQFRIKPSAPGRIVVTVKASVGLVGVVLKDSTGKVLERKTPLSESEFKENLSSNLPLDLWIYSRDPARFTVTIGPAK